MGKLLVLLLAALVLYLLWRGIKRDAARRADPDAAGDGERMVDCGQCGVHLPISEAIKWHGRYFCSDEHRRLFSR